MTGFTNGGNFPTKTPFQAASGGGNDAFVSKFNPAASGEASLIYSTYLGGVGIDQGNGIAVNSSGQAVVVGLTGSANFPWANAFDSTNQINEGFVTILSSTGTALSGSSFIGGSGQDNALNVAVGNGGLIYVVGHTLSSDFPMALPFQANRVGLRDAFFAKVRFGSGVLASSFIGGNGNDEGNGTAVKGNFIYVTQVDPVCDSMHLCLQYGEYFGLCELMKCDPLVLDCAGGDLCIPYGDGFVCRPDLSGEMGAVNDPCDHADACDAGLVCITTAEASSACMLGPAGCCQPVCEFIEGQDGDCPNPDQKCVQWFDPNMPIPEGYEDIGVCRIPA